MRRIVVLAAVLTLVLAVSAQTGKARTYNFDKDKPGQLPTGFHIGLTGEGPPPTWVVQADPTAPSKPNVLAQTSAEKIKYRYPLEIADNGLYRDVEVSMKFKAISGELDRSGGIALRLADAKNYYLCRANGVENNYRIYRVIDGKREQLAELKLPVSTGEWHTLRFMAVGKMLTCYFDSAPQLEVSDDTYKNDGQIGLWTKGDSVTHFDDLKVKPLKP